jgi:hypothetical protein
LKSGKQRKKELVIERAQRKARERRAKSDAVLAQRALGSAPCNPALLAPYNSYSGPDFAGRGFYIDRPFTCRDCGVDQVWTATQQKWWYEVAKGHWLSSPKRCRPCRRKVRDVKDENAKRTAEGLKRKAEGKKRP